MSSLFFIFPFSIHILVQLRELWLRTQRQHRRRPIACRGPGHVGLNEVETTEESILHRRCRTSSSDVDRLPRSAFFFLIFFLLPLSLAGLWIKKEFFHSVSESINTKFRRILSSTFGEFQLYVNRSRGWGGRGCQMLNKNTRAGVCPLYSLCVLFNSMCCTIYGKLQRKRGEEDVTWSVRSAYVCADTVGNW